MNFQSDLIKEERRGEERRESHAFLVSISLANQITSRLTLIKLLLWQHERESERERGRETMSNKERGERCGNENKV